MQPSVVFNLLPQFIIASMLSLYYFYWVSDAKYPVIVEASMFMHSPTGASSSVNNEIEFSPLHPERFREDTVKIEMTRALNSVSIWIVILLVASPTETLLVLVGSLPKGIESIVFTCLAAIFAVSLFSSVVDKIGGDRNRKITAVIVAAVISVISFYFPTIAWITRLRTIIVILYMYLAALGVVGLGYYLQWRIKRDDLITTGFLSSVSMYGVLVSLFAYTLILHAL